jgi:hypothetical protein
MRKGSIKKNTLFVLVSLILIFLGAGCSEDNNSDPWSSWGPTYGEDLERWIDGQGVVLLDAETTNGSIDVNGSSGFGRTSGRNINLEVVTGTQVYVYARIEIHANSLAEAKEFAQEVQIHTVRNGDMIRVYSEYPEPPHHVNVSVSFEIECPREIDLRLNTLNGFCRVNGMIASVEAISTNGNVEADMVDLTGHCRFTTVNGLVNVGIHDGIAPLTATTLNGSVTMTLHTGYNGLLDAQTGNGLIHCNFPISDYDQVTPNHIRGTLGSGGSTPVTLRAANGSIYLNRF